MTLTFELNLDVVKTIHWTICLGQRSFSSRATVRTYRQTDTQDR